MYLGIRECVCVCCIYLQWFLICIWTQKPHEKFISACRRCCELLHESFAWARRVEAGVQERWRSWHALVRHLNDKHAPLTRPVRLKACQEPPAFTQHTRMHVHTSTAQAAGLKHKHTEVVTVSIARWRTTWQAGYAATDSCSFLH